MPHLKEDEYIPINVVVDGITHGHYPNIIQGDLYMLMEYETAYGIFDHKAPDDPKVPWPLLAISTKESLNLIDPLDWRLDQYVENKVGELFRISFFEFIHQPRYDLLKMLSSAKKHSARLAAAGSEEMKRLQKAMAMQTPPPNKQ